MVASEADSGSAWTKEEDRVFETALATYPEDSPDLLWQRIHADLPGKSVEEIKNHYQILVHDIQMIESGRVPLPDYPTCSNFVLNHASDEGTSARLKHVHSENTNDDADHGCKVAKSEPDKRKGTAWSEREHRLFLMGLRRFGKGDWRSISRHYVISRTATQVASHAQKYFNRLNSVNRERRRSSIHDITSIGDEEEPDSEGPITGQTNPSNGDPPTHPLGHPASDPGFAMGPIVQPYMNYRFAVPPLPAEAIPNAPFHLGHFPYPITPSTTPQW